jgi:GAF domain-containing protein
VQRAQAAAQALTGSRIACFQVVEPDGASATAPGAMQGAWAWHGDDPDRVSDPAQAADPWAQTLRLRKPVVRNDALIPAPGVDPPGGPAAPGRLVVVPVLDGGRVALLAAVGGKADDYGDTDLATVQLIANETWRLLQRRRADAALALSEKSYRTLTEQVPAIIYRAELDNASTTSYVSPAVQALGYTAAQWLADPETWLRSLHPDDRDRVLATLQAARDAGRGARRASSSPTSTG